MVTFFFWGWLAYLYLNHLELECSVNSSYNYIVNITKIAGRILSLQERQISYFLPRKRKKRFVIS